MDTAEITAQVALRADGLTPVRRSLGARHIVDPGRLLLPVKNNASLPFVAVACAAITNVMAWMGFVPPEFMSAHVNTRMDDAIAQDLADAVRCLLGMIEAEKDNTCDLGLAQTLLNKRHRLITDGDTPLHFAVTLGMIGAAAALLCLGADFTAETANGELAWLLVDETDNGNDMAELIADLEEVDSDPVAVRRRAEAWLLVYWPSGVRRVSGESRIH